MCSGLGDFIERANHHLVLVVIEAEGKRRYAKACYSKSPALIKTLSTL